MKTNDENMAKPLPFIVRRKQF